MICGGSPCQDFSVAGNQKGSVWTCKDCENEDGTPFEWNPLTVHYSARHKCPHCGSENIDKSRSSLLVEWLRIIRGNRPNWGIYENVKAITSKKFHETFTLFLNELREYGYNTHWKVLNANDYGVPQNRERVYIFIIKKDLDNAKFKFPEPFDNGIRLKDVLEDEVDEKYYLSDDKVKRFITNLNSEYSLLYDPCQVKREGKSREYNDYCPILTSRDYKDPRLVNDNVVKQIGNITEGNGNWSNPQTGRIYSPDGVSPTLNTCGGGQREPKIICGIDKSNNEPQFIDKANCLTAREDRGVSNHKQEGTAVLEIKVNKIGNINPSGNGMNGNVFSDDGLTPTLTTNKGEGNKILQRPRGFNKGGLYDVCPTLSSHSWECNNFVSENNIRIRKLIPLETFRLMGFTDEEFFRAMIGLSDKANEFIEQHPYLVGKTILDEAETIQGISNSQLYKMSGNSIVVDVLYYIYVEIYKAMPYLFDDLRLSSFFSGIGAFESGLDRLFESIRTGNFTRPQVE